MPWPTLARLAISATAGAALTLALAAPLVHARPPDDLIAHDAIDDPGDPGDPGDPDGEFVCIRSGIDINCGERTDGSVYCWGLEPVL